MHRIIEAIATVLIVATTVIIIWFSYRFVTGTRVIPTELDVLPIETVHIDTTLESTSDRGFDGKREAPLILVEFSDLECPFCGRFARETSSRLRREYVDTGKIKYLFKHFPLERIHPRAVVAAAAAECAREQGQPYFWMMRQRLFANQHAFADTDLMLHSKRIGLDSQRFRQCVSEGRVERIRNDQEEGRRFGVTGTPTMLLGTTDPDGNVQFSIAIRGAVSYKVLAATLQQLSQRTRAVRATHTS